MGDVLVPHRAAALEADVADDDARRVGVRGAVGLEHRDDRADRVLVAVQPVRLVRDAVGDRVPRDPVGPVDRELGAVDQAAGVRQADRGRVMPVDRRVRSARATVRCTRPAVAGRRAAGGALGLSCVARQGASLSRVSTSRWSRRNVRLGGSSDDDRVPVTAAAAERGERRAAGPATATIAVARARRA